MEIKKGKRPMDIVEANNKRRKLHLSLTSSDDLNILDNMNTSRNRGIELKKPLENIDSLLEPKIVDQMRESCELQ